MNEPIPGKPSTRTSGDDRELFVTTDLRSIPAGESRRMFGSFSEWVKAVFSAKVLRIKSEPTFAYESRRMMRVEPEQVSKRIMKRFNQLSPEVEALGFLPNFYATLPAIGQVVAAVMTMSRRDGYIHFFANQVVLKTEGQITDAGYFGFSSRLTDGTLITTISPANLPKARDGLDRLVVDSDDPHTILRKHRRRIRNAEVTAVLPAELSDVMEKETRLEAEDYLRRRIIRAATAGEITRIRTESRV